jgi:23S rRNA pseudouridine1911/1915/1917 synthase
MTVVPEHHSFKVEPQDTGQRVDLFLTGRLPDASRAQVQRAAQAGGVRIEGVPVKVSHRVKAGEMVEIDLVRPDDPAILPEPEKIALDIVYSDDSIVVVNKPPGMVVHPAVGHRSGTLVNALLGSDAFAATRLAPSERPGIVHRLDKDTSGLIIVARTELAHRRLADQLKDRSLRRVYWAASWGHLKAEVTVFDGAIGRSSADRKRMAVTSSGRAASTSACVLERFALADLLEVTLETGRTHQIRVHLSHAGHPVVGDAVYGGGDSHLKGVDPSLRLLGRRMVEAIGRPALHAHRLALTHPITKEPLDFSVEPPHDFLELVTLCRRSDR